MAINSGAGLIGIPATMSCLALLMIWGLFIMLGIRIRRKGIRITGAFLLGITLSIMLGLSRPDLLQTGFNHGGLLGDWIYLNCKLSGLEGLAYFLSWIAVILSLLLATDWLFHEYITDALGIPHQPAVAGMPARPIYEPRAVEPLARPMSTVLEEPEIEPPVPAMEDQEEEEEKGIPVQESSTLPTNEWWVEPILGDKQDMIEEKGLLIDEPFQEKDVEYPEVDEDAPNYDTVAEEVLGADKITQESVDEPEAETSMEVTEETKPMDEESSLVLHAARLVYEQDEASISLLQQKLSIGYFKAAKLMDRLEKNGMISPPMEDGKREVLVTEDLLGSA